MQNRYLDKRATFMEPEVNQYGGSHMVMTNVMKEVKTRYVNMDTRFARDYGTLPVANHTIDFPERIQKVRSVSVTNVELPLTFYNVAQSFDNTTFNMVTRTSGNVIKTYTVHIPEGIYTTATDIFDAINTAMPAQVITGVNAVFEPNQDHPHRSQIRFISITAGMSVQFLFATSQSHGFEDCVFAPSPDQVAGFDRFNIKSKLGWMLGFRQPVYTVETTKTLVSEAFWDLNGPRYLYLAVDEFNNHAPQSTFVSMLPNSLLNKNILARISVIATSNNPTSFGTIEVANLLNGYLLSDTRSYSDDVDLQRMQVQLVDEYGRPVNLNGLDYAFTLCVKHT